MHKRVSFVLKWNLASFESNVYDFCFSSLSQRSRHHFLVLEGLLRRELLQGPYNARVVAANERQPISSLPIKDNVLWTGNLRGTNKLPVPVLMP